MNVWDVIRVLLGGILFLVSVIKISRPDRLYHLVESHGLPSVNWPPLVGMSQPFVEVTLGCLLLFGVCRRAALGATTVLSLGALLALAWAVSHGVAADCLMQRSLGLKPPFDALHMLRHAVLAGGTLALLLREFWLHDAQSRLSAAHR